MDSWHRHGVGTYVLTTYMISLRYLIGNKFLKDYWQSHYMPLPPWDIQAGTKMLSLLC